MRGSWVVAAGLAALAGCSPGSPAASPSASVTPSPVVSTPAVTPTPSRTPHYWGAGGPTPSKPTPSKPPSPSASAKPSVTPSATPSPKPPPGTVLTAKNAYLQASEDESLTTPDPENGCAVHDPDLDDVSCGVVRMAGGVATWIVGREQHTLPGASEPRMTVRLYRRLANGTDSLAFVGFGQPEQWGDVTVKTGSLTGQRNDTLVVLVTFRGSGTFTGYDLVTWRASSPMRLVAHHPEGSHAQVYVRSSGYVSTYVADYSDGSPTCCPTTWKHDNVRWYAPSFRLVKYPNVSSPPSS